MIYLILNGWLQHSSHHAAKFLFLLPAMTHLDLALLTPYFNFTNWTSNWATSIRDQNFNFDYTAVLRLIEWSTWSLTWSTLCIWCGGGRVCGGRSPSPGRCTGRHSHLSLQTPSSCQTADSWHRSRRELKECKNISKYSVCDDAPVAGEHGYWEEGRHGGAGGGEDARAVRRAGEPEPLRPLSAEARLLVVVDITVWGQGDGHRLESGRGQRLGLALAGGQWESVWEVRAVAIQAGGPHTRRLRGVWPAVTRCQAQSSYLTSAQLGGYLLSIGPRSRPGPGFRKLKINFNMNIRVGLQIAF